MTIVNSGSMFMKKYESDENAVRRFMLANQGATRYDYKPLCGNSLSAQVLGSLVRTTQTTQYWDSNKWLYRQNWISVVSVQTPMGRFSSSDSPKRCPTCAEAVFHSHLYSFSWLKKCPIHGVELTDNCPQCGQSWPQYWKFETNNCPMCGTVRPKSFELRRRQVQGHTRDEEQTLGLFWSFRMLDWQFAKVLHYDFVSHGTDSGILYGSREFPELAVTFYPEHTELFEKVGAPASGLKERKFDAEPIQLAEVKEMRIDESASFSFVRTSIDKIEEEIWTALRLPKQEASSGRYSKYVSIDFIGDYNIKELAFDIWKSIVECAVQAHPREIRCKRIFELLKVPQPGVPPIVRLVYSNDFRQFATPNDEFRAWMYKKQLKNLFIYIYKHALLLKYILLTKEPTAAITDWTNNKCVLWQPTYQSFKIRIIRKNVLQIVYESFPTWEELLDDTKQFNSQRLDKHFSYWRETFLRYVTAEKEHDIYHCIRRK